MAEEDKIALTLSREQFPRILERYSLEKIKEMAISMALAQYKERPLTREMLHSSLVNLEMDLERMFPPPKTAEEQAEAEAEAAEEERLYQEAIAEMKPYMVNGKQAKVNENGEFPNWQRPEGGYLFPVWVDKDGRLTVRVYSAGWDWMWLEDPEGEDEEEE
jgi:arsenate reductase-like glutaredoxin family protein